MVPNEDEKSAFLKAEIVTKLDDERSILLRQKRQARIWAVIAGFLLFLSLASNIWQSRRPRYGAFPTDLKDARRAIKYETRVYTGALIWDPKQKGLVRVKEPGEIEYFGPPGQAVDDAWHNLLHGQFPTLTDAEALPYLPNLTVLPQTGRYHVDPDFFHSLHCLNGIRTMLAGPLYGKKIDHMLGASKQNMRAHMDHCMDRIRQALMCHGDLSPSPLYLYDGKYPIGKAGEHTCRKWEPIRAWMDGRGRKGPVYGEH